MIKHTHIQKEFQSIFFSSPEDCGDFIILFTLIMHEIFTLVMLWSMYDPNNRHIMALAGKRSR